jgi:hypothetical protein
VAAAKGFLRAARWRPRNARIRGELISRNARLPRGGHALGLWHTRSLLNDLTGPQNVTWSGE